jgi:hypothetical protein
MFAYEYWAKYLEDELVSETDFFYSNSTTME